MDLAYSSPKYLLQALVASRHVPTLRTKDYLRLQVKLSLVQSLEQILHHTPESFLEVNPRKMKRTRKGTAVVCLANSKGSSPCRRRRTPPLRDLCQANPARINLKAKDP